MKAKKNTAFTVTIVAIYVLTVVLYVASLFVEYRKGEEKAVNRFNDITRDVSRISLAYQPRSEKFYDEILSSLGNISDIAGLQLNFGNELIFSYPKDMQELNSIRSYLVFQRTTKVFASSGIPVSIKASIYKLKPSSIYYKGRIAFIVIFAATLVTAFYLVLYVRNGTFPTEAENDDLDEDEMDYPDVSTYDLTPEETNEINSQLSTMNAENEEDFMEESLEEPSENTEEPSETSAEEKEEDVLAFLNNKKDEENSEAEISEPADETKDQPKGLFCPETGFGWEEYMITRLDSELLRSASSDQDISLFTIKVPGIDWNSESGKKLSKIIIEQVKFNDLVFHHGEDGVSAIIQNQNTDQALMTAENLKMHMDKSLEESGSSIKTAIGISTRSLRLISASRLANESEEALKRALADSDSPIIAFRVNPERYKDYLASESFQEKDRPAEKAEDEKLLEDLPEPPAEDDEDDEIPTTAAVFEPEESVPNEDETENEPVPEPVIDDEKKEKDPFDELEDFEIDEELKL